MAEINLAELRETYGRREAFLKNVLDSPKPYFYDVRQILKDLWTIELRIIAITGTIYNGL